MIHCGIWDWYLRGYANEVRRHLEGKWPQDRRGGALEGFAFRV